MGVLVSSSYARLSYKGRRERVQEPTGFDSFEMPQAKSYGLIKYKSNTL